MTLSINPEAIGLFLKTGGSLGRTGILFITIIIALTAFNDLYPQWSGNPESNRKLIENTVNPVNLNVINDPGRGFYVLWQEKDGNTGDLFYQHLNYDGNPSFFGNGIKVNSNKASLDPPQGILGINNTLVLLWKEIFNENHQVLNLQRFKSNGYKFWTGSGAQINQHVEQVASFAVTSDTEGFAAVSFIERTPLPKIDYRIKLQRVSVNGYAEFPDDGVSVASSQALKTNLQMLQAPDGGVLIFWVEVKNRSNILNVKYMDARGRMRWFKTGNELVGGNFNIMNYKAVLYPGTGFHLSWTSMNSKNSIYHQLFDFTGSSIWPDNYKTVNEQNASLSIPQVCITSDNAIAFGWVAETKNKRAIRITKYGLNGNDLWQEPRSPYYADSSSNNFGLSLIPDERGGVIAAWFTKNPGDAHATVYAQRLGIKSEVLWGQAGIAVARSQKTEKSYLNIVPDSYNGIVAVFKESTADKHGIFGQRIFSNKNYTSQISQFHTDYWNDTVTISWAVANESGVLGYKVERTLLKEKDEESIWTEVGNVTPKNLSVTGRYSYKDSPRDEGSYFYRVIQIGSFGELNVSNTERVDYFPERNDKIFVIPGQQLVFGDSSVISFNLPEPAEVSIELFNSRLEKLEEFQLTETHKGINKFVFYSRKYPQGVYYYRFRADDFVDVKKLVISRSGWR